MSEERTERYLWDPEAEPDPQVQRLERLLAPWRYGARQRDREEIEAALAGLLRPRRSRWPRRLWPLPFLVAAASLALILHAPWGGPAYRVQGVDGVARVRAGQRIRVGDRPARLEIADIGEVELDPGSRLVVQAIRTGKDARHALYMERGALHARIVAEPRVFQVGTPAGISIDLGCEYRLEVGQDERCTVHVLTGRISFKYEGREVYVPAGAACESVPGRGPSPPMFASISEELRGLVERAFAGEELDPEEVGGLVGIEERRDALPLFALMTDERVARSVREAIFELFRGKFETPESITRDGVLGGDETQRLDWLEAVKHWWRY